MTRTHATLHGPSRGPPGFRTEGLSLLVKCLRACMGPSTPRDPVRSRIPSDPVWPWAYKNSLGVPEQLPFGAQSPSPHVPLSTLRPRPCERTRMTRSRCGSLRLHRMELSSTTPHRLRPAHVAVGTAVARRPPHGSRRAELPHRALASDNHAQSLLGIRLTDARHG
jgi:hypothetical protein